MIEKENNLDFYKEQYIFEYERARFYDQSIQFPTTLLIVYIGGSVYSFKEYFNNGNILLCSYLDWIFLGIYIVFSISIIFTIYYMSSVFHGFTREYHFLPSLNSLKKYETDLYKYYYRYESGTYSEKRMKAKKSTLEHFNKNLKKDYIKMTSLNQIVNDKRANSFYITRSLLFINLILLIIVGIMGFLF
ncbi:hypothetical protein [Polaribacter cellanae]|uniref:Uncharacterized protein n=1 Tax=Polaribacter cellanae TaxID=2818493 RepID=A0A975CM39_9FLAO|nr:hypothetical protein [Polaribacter cellanae]QTE21129.1 hypothetical protein J3359_09725 [Polaribacter cellanae]